MRLKCQINFYDEFHHRLFHRDTVASIGISGRELPFDKPLTGTGLRVFRHALALDERRAKFIPNFKLTDDGTLSRSDHDVNSKVLRELQLALDVDSTID